MKCKLNDIAYIRKSLRPENIGLVVRCKTYLGYFIRGEDITISGEIYGAFDTDHYWMIENDCSELETQFGKSRESFILDSWLDPIVPKGEDTDIKTKIEFDDRIDA